MASIRKIGIKWLAEVRQSYPKFYKSKRFNTKNAAMQWAIDLEASLGQTGNILHRTFADALMRYKTDISPNHKGTKKEIIRIDKLLREDTIHSKVDVNIYSANHLQDHIDKALKYLKPDVETY